LINLKFFTAVSICYFIKTLTEIKNLTIINKVLNAMMKRSMQCRPVERVIHRLKGDLGAELQKVASEQVVNKAKGRTAIEDCLQQWAVLGKHFLTGL